MFGFMLAKLKHKKWMVLCLLIGNVLLIAVSASQSIYKTASFERMFEEEFDRKLEKTGKWPFVLRATAITALPETAEEKFQKSVEIAKDLNLPIKESRFHFRIREEVAASTLEREDMDSVRMSVGIITGMEEKIELIAGRMYEDTGDDNLIEVIVNQEALKQMDVLLDEVLVMENVLDNDKEPLYIKIVGIFVPVDKNDFYWTDSQADMGREGFMMPELFLEIFRDREHHGFELRYDTLFDYENIDSKQAEAIQKKTNKWLNTKLESMNIQTPEYLEVLDTFLQKEKKISATLFILQIPCLVLLCAFLFMISEQMLRMEQNEISMLKSRGAKRSQILSLYFMQSMLIAILGFVIGLPVGTFLCSMLGSAGAFLEFNLSELLPTQLTMEAVIYGVAAMGISLAMTVLPVVKYSGVSIVNLKQRSQKITKPFWQKCFLDLILIALGGYAFYNFTKTQANVREQVLRGESLDPFLYFGATFFILGLGLLFLRLHPLFIKLLYKIRKKRLSSAAYMSFLSTIRTSSKQQFIMLFMILTVAFGIFYATIARTILQNAENNLSYFTPVDVVMQEKWKDNSAIVGTGEDAQVEYYEPDFGGYEFIEGLTGITKVLQDKARIVGGRASVKSECYIMGINTKEFGEMVDMPDNLLPLDFYDYLNALANTPNGVLLSENMRKEYGYEIGNTLLINLKNRKFSLQVVGFVDYWPTYQSKVYSINKDNEIAVKDEYLLVANLSYVQRKADVTPYGIWMNFEDETDGFYNYVNDNDIKVKSYTDVIVAKEDLRKETLFQGTNGILSLSFMVILLLCAVGYLIYWILSIRSRELLFGILRAMGMSKNEVFHILLNEQIFCGILSVLTGVGIGAAAAVLYVPIIQNAYAATDQMLPLELVCQTGDLTKLFGTVIAVLIICITVLLRIVSKSNITGALKLGED